MPGNGFKKTGDGKTTPDTAVFTDADGAYKAYVRGTRQTVVAVANLSYGNSDVAAWDFSGQVQQTLVDSSRSLVLLDLTPNEAVDISGSDGWPSHFRDEMFTAGANARTAFYQHRDFMQSHWSSGWEFDGTQNFLIDPDFDHASTNSTTYDIHMKSWFGDPVPPLSDIRFLQHELAHVAWLQARSDIVLHSGGLHFYCEPIDMDLAMAEGWADAVCALIPDQDPTKFAGRSDQYCGAGTIETNDWWYDVFNPDPYYGMYYEAAVATLLYDCLDTYAGDDDPLEVPFRDMFAAYLNIELPPDDWLSILWYVDAMAALEVIPAVEEQRAWFCADLDLLHIRRDWPRMQDFCVPNPNDVNDGETEAEQLPTSFEVRQNYPNPFNGSTVLTVAVPGVGDLAVHVYNILGQVVSAQVRGNMKPGRYLLNLDLSERASGVYFVRVALNNEFRTIKALYIK